MYVGFFFFFIIADFTVQFVHMQTDFVVMKTGAFLKPRSKVKILLKKTLLLTVCVYTGNWRVFFVMSSLCL